MSYVFGGGEKVEYQNENNSGSITGMPKRIII